MKKIKIGLAPTKRAIFSAPAAVEYANLTRQKLREMNIDFIDIDGISEDELLHDENDEIRIAEYFRSEGIDGLGLISSMDELNKAFEVYDTDGVYLVPVFSGLGAPWFESSA